RSRQRLVTAQDDERRKIERDLHDGAQHQLVALAAELRRASTEGTTAAELSRLASYAEDSMFALQDLARGIFPSVLIDQGLVAAMRTHAARLPISVSVVVQPSIVGERFPADVETALYFVALEGLANVQKHAPRARVTLTLRREPVGRLVLDLYD